MALPLTSINLNIKSIDAYTNEFTIKQHVIDPINNKRTYTTQRALCKSVEDNLINMHDYQDIRYVKLHLIKDTSLLQGGPLAKFPASIDRGYQSLTYGGAQTTYVQQEYVIQYTIEQERFL